MSNINDLLALIVSVDFGAPLLGASSTGPLVKLQSDEKPEDSLPSWLHQ